MRIVFICLLVQFGFSCTTQSTDSTDLYAKDTIHSSLADTIASEFNVAMSFKESIDGIAIPDSIATMLCLIDVSYFGFDSLMYTGQMVVSKQLRDEIIEIFSQLANNKFPIQKIVPISSYNWSDSLSMLANNTSCFNYRKVKGSHRLSMHSYGKAIDINPFVNPYIAKDGSIEPLGAIYDPNGKGAIGNNSFIVKLFKENGWKWGGDWKYSKDYQHFYKQ